MFAPLNLMSTVLCSLAFQGEAKSAQLIGEATAKNPAFVTLRKIEAGREIAQIISNSDNKVYLNSDSLLLNLQELNLS